MIFLTLQLPVLAPVATIELTEQSGHI